MNVDVEVFRNGATLNLKNIEVVDANGSLLIYVFTEEMSPKLAGGPVSRIRQHLLLCTELNEDIELYEMTEVKLSFDEEFHEKYIDGGEFFFHTKKRELVIAWVSIDTAEPLLIHKCSE